MSKKHWWLLLLIFFLGAFLYSPAGYAYFSLPFLKIFGLSAFSVRFASAFFGSLTILLVYFLAKELFLAISPRRSAFVHHPRWLAPPFFASFLPAISPWHLNLSRTATENVIVVFFLALGGLFLAALAKKKKFDLVGRELLPKYSKAVIANRESAPTIFFLFFGKYDPALFQKETAETTMKDFDRINFSSYEFSEEECPQSISNEKGVLYTNSANCESIKGSRVIEEITRTDNSAAFRLEEYLK